MTFNSLKTFSFGFLLLFLVSPLWCLETTPKIGLYTGTFDPPHRGHIQLALKMGEKLGLSKIYFIPNYEPGHKPGSSSFSDRYEMVRATMALYPKLEVLPQEILSTIAEEMGNEQVAGFFKWVESHSEPGSRLFHLCGLDSLYKMGEKGKLPQRGENRVVAVAMRKGVPLIWSPTIRKKIQQGQVVFFDLDLPEISSSKIRKELGKGIFQTAQKELNPLTLGLIHRKGLYSLTPERHLGKFDPSSWKGPPHWELSFFTSEKISKFINLPLTHLMEPPTYQSPPLLDVLAYLQGKIPADLFLHCLKNAPEVTLFAGKGEELRDHLALFGEKFWKSNSRKDRVGLDYFIHEDGTKVFIGNLFGEDRLTHLAAQWSHFYHLAGISLDKIHLMRSPFYEKIMESAIQKTLDGISFQPESTLISLGYSGSLGYLIQDLNQLNPDLTQTSFDQFNSKFPEQASAKKHNPYPLQGTPEFPYRHLPLLFKGRQLNILSFRNLYGDQTGAFLNQCLNRGFRNFLVFGNGGGLSPKAIKGRIYAPTVVHRGKAILPLTNFARDLFIPIKLTTLPTILNENKGWMNSVHNYDAVDVEGFSLGDALGGNRNKNPILFSGILITDYPGGSEDITQKDEDDPEFIRGKREFFYKGVQFFLHRWVQRNHRF